MSKAKSQAERDYHKLLEISKHARILAGIRSLLDWDHETYMPKGAGGIRAEQMKALTGLVHKEITGKPFSRALEKLVNLKTGKVKAAALDEPKKAALREWRRDYLKMTCLPTSFVEEFAALSSKSMQVWQEAKRSSDFSIFEPFLEKIITMCRKKADYLGYSDHPYDALLDEFEPDTTTKEIAGLFNPLKTNLTKLVQKISSKKTIDDSFLFGNFPQAKQLEFGQLILQSVGYSDEHGRLDLSTHPFSSACHPTDSRITTRIHKSSLMSNIFTILHEFGHSLYEMNLPASQYGSPLCDAISHGIHESQSRFWETRIGRSKAFWENFLPLLKKQFKGKLDKVALPAFYRSINKVEPSFIRVEADEVTYSLHVILRFEMERDLIAGKMKVSDIPDAWNEKMENLLGITPANDAEGCLQDVHWSMGAFGYFPSYTLGNLYAAQLFTAFARAFPNWEKRVAKGELDFIKEWLHQNVHQYGRQYSSRDLLQKITKKQFSSKYFIEYITNKYEEIYK